MLGQGTRWGGDRTTRTQKMVPIFSPKGLRRCSDNFFGACARPGCARRCPRATSFTQPGHHIKKKKKGRTGVKQNFPLARKRAIPRETKFSLTPGAGTLGAGHSPGNLKISGRLSACSVPAIFWNTKARRGDHHHCPWMLRAEPCTSRATGGLDQAFPALGAHS